MKKLILFIAAAFIAAVALTGCAPSTESSDWLKGTTWKADLSGVQYRDNGIFGLRDNYETLEDGYISIHFTTNGYRLHVSTKSMESIEWTRIFPDYDFPSLYFPISWEEENKKPVNIIYDVGTISEDFKTIHFETFRNKYTFGDQICFHEFKDVVFRRK